MQTYRSMKASQTETKKVAVARSYVKLCVAPEGWEPTVKKMKKHPEIDNPWALAWWMKGEGAKPGRKGQK